MPVGEMPLEADAVSLALIEGKVRIDEALETWQESIREELEVLMPSVTAVLKLVHGVVRQSVLPGIIEDLGDSGASHTTASGSAALLDWP